MEFSRVRDAVIRRTEFITVKVVNSLEIYWD